MTTTPAPHTADRPLRLGINLLAWGSCAGRDRLALSDVEALATQPGLTLRAYVPRSCPALPAGIERATIGWPFTTRTGRTLYEQFRLHARICEDKLDALYCPYGVMPRYSLIPTAAMFTDALFLSSPELAKATETGRQQRLSKVTLERAARLLVPAQALCADLIRLGGNDLGGKIRVVPPASHAQTNATSLPEEEKERMRSRYGLPNPYILAPGSLQWRENPTQLVAAWFAAVTNRRLPHRLVVPAGEKTTPPAVRKAIRELGVADRVIFTGDVKENDRPALFAMASLLLMPTLAEETRYELLEARAAGIPVVCADHPLFRQLCGASAVYAEAGNLPSLRETLERALTQPPTLQPPALTLAERGALLTAILRDMIEPNT